MSKKKTARMGLRAGEKVLKMGMMDYCVTGQYRPLAAGDAVLTPVRFVFCALESGLSFEIPLSAVYAVEKTGVPFFTQSMVVVTDEKKYRLNALFVGRWVKAIRAAVEAAKDAGEKSSERT